MPGSRTAQHAADDGRLEFTTTDPGHGHGHEQWDQSPSSVSLWKVALRLLRMIQGRQRWLLIRRHQDDPDKRAYYLVFAPAGATLAELAGAADLRRTTWNRTNKKSPIPQIAACSPWRP